MVRRVPFCLLRGSLSDGEASLVRVDIRVRRRQFLCHTSVHVNWVEWDLGPAGWPEVFI